jgi:hypothetical protein
MMRISNRTSKSVSASKHLILILIISILAATTLLSGCARNGDISKKLQADGFDIYIYSDDDIETREQFDELKKGKYYVKFELRSSGPFYVELEYDSGELKRIVCDNGFDDSSGAFYVIDLEKSAEYYCAYYLQDYDAPSEYYYKMVKGSMKDVIYFFDPEKKLNKEDGEKYIGFVKEYLKKYGLDKETLLNLGKETRYFRDYLPKRDEIQDGEDENN